MIRWMNNENMWYKYEIVYDMHIVIWIVLWCKYMIGWDKWWDINVGMKWKEHVDAICMHKKGIRMINA